METGRLSHLLGTLLETVYLHVLSVKFTVCAKDTGMTSMRRFSI